MSRFFIKSEDFDGQKALINGNDAHHIINVLRLKKGDKVEIAVLGKSYEAIIELAENNCVSLKVGKEIITASETDEKVYLLVGVSKGEKMDWVIEKATELGVFAVIPVMLNRCVVRLDEKGAQNKQSRWQRIAEAAAKHCRRNIIPQIYKPCKLEEAIQILPENTSLIVLWENESEENYKDLLKGVKEINLALLTGAEGGIEFEEIEFLRSKGALTASMGNRILRAETAAIVALALAEYETGDLGGGK